VRPLRRRPHNDLDPKATIYAHETVKNALLKIQHDKCAFCECKVTHQQYGDVEHFRPKKGYKQKEGDLLGRPGYYWLAYEWTNLLVSCQICNQKFKKNLFPLKRPARRARCHNDDVTKEEPLLIDPAADDPAAHLTFHQELYRPMPSSRRGKTTIDAFGLNEMARAEHRRDHFIKLRTVMNARPYFAEACRANPSSLELAQQLSDIDALLAESQADSAEYAAMARAVFR
jgi:uncharacterized protein (TIGR02646 family)